MSHWPLTVSLMPSATFVLKVPKILHASVFWPIQLETNIKFLILLMCVKMRRTALDMLAKRQRAPALRDLQILAKFTKFTKFGMHFRHNPTLYIQFLQWTETGSITICNACAHLGWYLMTCKQRWKNQNFVLMGWGFYHWFSKHKDYKVLHLTQQTAPHGHRTPGTTIQNFFMFNFKWLMVKWN